MPRGLSIAPRTARARCRSSDHDKTPLKIRKKKKASAYKNKKHLEALSFRLIASRHASRPRGHSPHSSLFLRVLFCVPPTPPPRARRPGSCRPSASRWGCSVAGTATSTRTHPSRDVAREQAPLVAGAVFRRDGDEPVDLLLRPLAVPRGLAGQVVPVEERVRVHAHHAQRKRLALSFPEGRVSAPAFVDQCASAVRAMPSASQARSATQPRKRPSIFGPLARPAASHHASHERVCSASASRRVSFFFFPSRRRLKTRTPRGSRRRDARTRGPRPTPCRGYASRACSARAGGTADALVFFPRFLDSRASPPQREDARFVFFEAPSAHATSASALDATRS